jgi:hypothetical protein
VKVNGQSFTEQALSLRDMWQSTIPGECPAVQQFGTWLSIHRRNSQRIEWAIRELAIKLTKHQMDDEYKIKFVSSIMNAEARKTQEAAQ